MVSRYSIIVPVYNAEQTIERCINSVLSAKVENYELILVDDGSTDNSSHICKEYAAENSIIRYVHKTNEGVSSARNDGLRLATGEWILFLDSDDYFLSQWQETCDRFTQNAQVDMVIFPFYIRNDHSEILTESKICSGTSKCEIAGIVSREIKGMRLNSPYAKLFFRETIERYKLHFPEELAIGEDLVFTFSYALRATSIAVNNIPFYCVNTSNTESLSRKRRDYLIEHLLAGDQSNLQSLEAVSDDLDPKSYSIYKDALAWSYYRKAYSASRELLKYEYSMLQRLKKEYIICSMFDKTRVEGCKWKTRAMSIPVRWKLVIVIDYLVRQRSKKNKDRGK